MSPEAAPKPNASPVDELWEKHGEFFARVGIDRDLPAADQLKQVREILYGECLLSKMHHELRGLLLSGKASLTGRHVRAVIRPGKPRRLVPLLDAQALLAPEEFEK